MEARRMADTMTMLIDRDPRYAEAYLRLAKEARYRPEAPGDGCGNINLSADEQRDPVRLEQEAVAYALRFAKEEDTGSFCVGYSNFGSASVSIGRYSSPIDNPAFRFELARVDAGEREA
jgi:hypothetical protein